MVFGTRIFRLRFFAHGLLNTVFWEHGFSDTDILDYGFLHVVFWIWFFWEHGFSDPV